MMGQLRKGLTAYLADDAAFASFMHRARTWHDKYDGPLRRLETDAVWTAVADSDDRAPPTKAEWFDPSDAPSSGLIFYVHGGSFVAERSPRITQLVARFAASAQARAYAPSYRLAPEHACPAAIDDIVASWRWLKKTHPDQPVVALAESAGATILLAALQRLRDEGDTMPEGLVLLSPWADLSLQSWSVMAASITRTSPHTMESLAMFAHFYLQGRSAIDPVASPLFGSFHDFPPILIHASRTDILYDDALRLAERIREVNGDLTLRHWMDETHVWERMNTPESRQSIELAAAFIRRCLDRNSALNTAA